MKSIRGMVLHSYAYACASALRASAQFDDTAAQCDDTETVVAVCASLTRGLASSAQHAAECCGLSGAAPMATMVLMYPGTGIMPWQTMMLRYSGTA